MNKPKQMIMRYDSTKNQYSLSQRDHQKGPTFTSDEYSLQIPWVETYVGTYTAKHSPSPLLEIISTIVEPEKYINVIPRHNYVYVLNG